MATDAPVRLRDPITAPSQADRFVAEASTIVGGPVGRHARLGAATFWTPVRVLIVMVMATFVAGVGLKMPCSTHAWSGYYQYSRMCYSDVYALYFSERINDGAVPYVDHPVEYPVVIGGLMYAAGAVSQDASDFYLVTSGLLLVGAVVTVALSSKLAGRRRPWDAALIALAPGILLHGTTNWDLAAVALATLALWAWSRRLPALSGLWLGLAIATKFYPALFLVGLFFLCVRARRLVDWLQCAAVAGVTTVLVYLPVMLKGGSFPVDKCQDDGSTVSVLQPAWQRFFTLNKCRPADWDSWAFAWSKITHHTLDAPKPLNDVTTYLGAFVVCAVGALVIFAPRRPRLMQVLFLLVAGCLLVNKVFSPQFTLWLVPLAALARPRWGAFMAWQVAELGVLFTRFYFFIGMGDPPGKGVPWWLFVGAVGVRDALLLLLMGLVVRDILRPYHDVVRRDGEDDPAGGVLDGALDRAEQSVAARVPVPA